MNKKTKEKKEAGFRIVVAIVSGIILCVWRYIIFVLAIVNFFIVLTNGKKNKQMADFCEYWNTELYRFARYLTFVSNTRPFPFTDMEKMSKVE